ncbi:YybH family protein [Acidicapsa ligni]|uniref:YybH family protein n=1 Tax=Acidicapsa ligni TaxID=542300 RepID=UPI0021DF55B8|nr:nuclear transport factor 2 family protein [Acidicapsa ligni]
MRIRTRNYSGRQALAILLALVFGLANLAFAQRVSSRDIPGNGDKAAIRSVLDAQVAAWNRADIPGFMASYENSPETTFIGIKINKGFAPIMERYKKSYTNKEQMGTLTFADLEIRLLPSASGATEYAVVTGRFHLERTARGEAKKDDGIFSLVWHKGSDGWKILLDHTS